MDNAVIWDGIGSALVGGILSGIVVILGVWLAQRWAERSAAMQARRLAADRLIVEVKNLRDKILESDRGRAGDFSMWPLNNEVLIAASRLGDYTAFKAVENFAYACDEYRNWWRYRIDPTHVSIAQQDASQSYRGSLAEHSYVVIAQLQRLAQDDREYSDFPPYPELPVTPR